MNVDFEKLKALTVEELDLVHGMNVTRLGNVAIEKCESQLIRNIDTSVSAKGISAALDYIDTLDDSSGLITMEWKASSCDGLVQIQWGTCFTKQFFNELAGHRFIQYSLLDVGKMLAPLVLHPTKTRHAFTVTATIPAIGGRVEVIRTFVDFGRPV